MKVAVLILLFAMVTIATSYYSRRRTYISRRRSYYVGSRRRSYYGTMRRRSYYMRRRYYDEKEADIVPVEDEIHELIEDEIQKFPDQDESQLDADQEEEAEDQR